MSIRNLIPEPRSRRAVVVALVLTACTDSGLPTAPPQPLAPTQATHDMGTPVASPALVVVPASVSINEGGGIALHALNVDPLNAAQANAPITWTSSNPSIATVSSTGQVRALARGTATITASAMNGQFVASSTVAISPRPTCLNTTRLPITTGKIMPIPTAYEDTPLLFRFTLDDQDPCPRFTFRLLELPIAGDLYQVAEDGTPLLDAAIGVGTYVSNSRGWVAYYTSIPGYYGYDSFRYDTRDERGTIYRFLPVMPIQILPVNDPPVAAAATHVGDNNVSVTNVFIDATDVDGSNPQRCIVELPQNGDLYWSSVTPENRVAKGDCRQSSSLRYVSRIDGVFGCGALPARSTYPHTDSFRWYASDGRAISDTVSDIIRIDYVNQPPEYGGPASVATSEDTPVSFALSASDPDGNVFAYRINTLPQHGALWVIESGSTPRQISTVPALFLANADGTTSLQYVPDLNFNTTAQSDDFHFQLTDGDLLPTCDQVLRFDVAPVNDAPTMFVPDNLTAIVGPGGIGQTTVVFGIRVFDDARPTDVLSMTLRAQGPAAARIGIANPSGFAVQRISDTEIRFDGTLATINALLDRGVEWTPNGSGADYGELAIMVDDHGNFGAGGARVGTKIAPVSVGFDGDGLERMSTPTPTRACCPRVSP